MKRLAYLDEMYKATDAPLRRFAVAVPHQRPAHIVDPVEFPPIEEDGDARIAGDHDLHGVHLVESLDDAQRLLIVTNGHGGQARHQAARIAAVVLDELLGQGAVQEMADDDED